MQADQKLKEAFDKKCKTDEPMSKHTTLQIGGPAKFFITARTQEELISAVKKAIKNKVQYLVIGAGSNLLVADRGFEGLIILNKTEGISIEGKKAKVASGTNLFKFIKALINESLAGMEKMSGIPGTVGGAIYGNAGAYGQTISDCLLSVKVFDGKRTKILTKKECKFGYRDSVFKKDRQIILEAEFEFGKALAELLKRISLNTLEMRLRKYPPDLKCPGSFFKNILAKNLKPSIIKKIPEEKIVYEKVPAGYLMETVGAKGAQVGNVKIAGYHGNLIINLGEGKASEFYELATNYAQKVKQKFSIDLEPEVQLIGFKNTIWN